MPSEPEDEATTNRVLMMDMDLDLAASWQLDQIDESSFLLSISEHQQQPFSPLWAFSDDGNLGGFMGGGGFRLPDCSRVHSDTRNPEVETGNELNPGEKKKLPSPPTRLIPNENPYGYCLIKERMTQALRYFKDLSEQHVLAQVWAPIKHNGRRMLTTSGQPFVLDPNSNGLPQYRLVSQIYMFSIDGDNDGNLGLPGRVFRQKLPEWTPNVQYYSSEEFPRLTHALHYNVRGTLALPVFEPSGQSCVGVLELIMTSQKINYAPEVDKVCKALEAVNLKSSEILDHQSTQICNQARQNALAEILEIITVVCETHTLPLAQTWVPCMHGTILANGGSFMKTCSSFDGSCKDQVCMSTTDVAFYVVDAHMWGFRDACAEHHLQRGQGVCGRAFASRSPCFCCDITEFCKTEYPLVHYARMFRLRSSFAICLQNDRTGDDDYVLEFFLPVNVESYEEQRALLGSIVATIKEHIGSLRVASGRELEQELRSIEIIKALGVEKQVESRPNFGATSPPKIAIVPDGATLNGESNANGVKENAVVKDPCKKPERKRGKAEKTISLDVLQQYFAGSLKDAAKSLGVCPTTMKRICRQHGISRWPSRKINKVNRSLSKLKRVIESVQGGEGTTFSLTSLAAANPIPVTVGSVSWAANLDGPNQPSGAGPVPSQSREDKKQFNVTRAQEHDKQAERISASKADFSRGEGAYRSRTASGSREESIETPTSQGSCQGSPQNDQVVSPIYKNKTQIEGSNNERVCQEMGEVNLAAGFSIQNGFITAPDEQFEQMQLEDVGSSHDLKNLCPQNEQPLLDEHVITEYSWTKSPPRIDSAVKDKQQIAPSNEKRNLEKSRGDIITIKAAYREDIIRFRLAIDSGIAKLREEVSKRFKLEIETFDVKYLDDDHEWVLIACDADLQECIDLSRSLGNRMVRLVVNEIGASLGSSCDSSGNEL